MNQIMVNIKSRRSRRNFFDRDISDGIIEETIEAGRYAPSALNKQPWKFIVIANRGLIRKLSSIIRDKSLTIVKFLPILKLFKSALRDPQVIGAVKKTVSSKEDAVFYNAPLLIIIAADKRSGQYVSKDCALASQNMMLYAHSVGISSCFIGRAEILQMSRIAKKMIGLPPYHMIQSAIVFGYAPQDTAKTLAPDRKKDNITNWVR